MNIETFVTDIGKYAKDKVTKFEGVVTAITLWDRGDIQYGLQPESVDGELKDAKRFDIDFLTFIKTKSIDVSNIIYKPFKFENGQEVKCLKNGFRGYVTGCCIFINGCRQYYVVANKIFDGKEIAGWFEEIDLELLKKTVPAINEKIGGGPITTLQGRNR